MNNSLLIKVILILTSFSFMNTYGQDLEKHKWTNRILIVKTLDVQSKKYKEQVKEFTNSTEELIDRKLILYKIVNNDFTLTNYTNSSLNSSGKVSGKLAENILDAKENFEIILIGLDGGIKIQQTKILTKEHLFNTIDAMPMRKNEMEN
ncbi:hypothetical protein Murru_2084 [Allomuricauda ruestringensis DSM 13258]|uniref:DUF4174 domain-containing protein n=2 Tax=Flagellimonas TaxID=444459 RepID=G2PLN6_ALLRU|nr:hypothetical protein Murru_2084 [Allomuricauda ruestringensis DSM 13258]